MHAVTVSLHRMSIRHLVAMLVVAWGCGIASVAPAADKPELANPPPSPPQRNADYRIAVRDMIQFQVYEEPDVLVVQRVTASGEIRLPLIGTVEVAGLTLREAEAKLRDLFVTGGFYVSPQIILSLQQYTERSISVLGQVNRPDQIQFPLETRSIGLVQAITYAGGLTRLAKTDAIQIVRVDENGREGRFTVNLDGYLANRGTGGKQFQLVPGDIVFVPERTF